MGLASAKGFRFNSTDTTLPTVKENRFQLYHILLDLCEHWEKDEGEKITCKAKQKKKNFFFALFCCPGHEPAKFERLQELGTGTGRSCHTSLGTGRSLGWPWVPAGSLGLLGRIGKLTRLRAGVG